MCSSQATQAAFDFDAVIVLGGGLTAGGTPHPFVEARLREGAALAQRARYAILLSRGTTHKPPPQNPNGFPVDESAASARYFRSLLPEDYNMHARVLLDGWSLDTIGNCYFTLRMHCEPLGLRRLAIVTSAFHMPRTESIFRHIFGALSPEKNYRLTFISAKDEGLAPEILKLRQEKERRGLEQWQATMARCNTCKKLTEFLFLEHGAYNCRGSVGRIVIEEEDRDDDGGADPKVAATY